MYTKSQKVDQERKTPLNISMSQGGRFNLWAELSPPQDVSNDLYDIGEWGETSNIEALSSERGVGWLTVLISERDIVLLPTLA